MLATPTQPITLPFSRPPIQALGQPQWHQRCRDRLQDNSDRDELHLVTEAPTDEALVAKLTGMLEDLLEDVDIDTEVPFDVVARIVRRMSASGAWRKRLRRGCP